MTHFVLIRYRSSIRTQFEALGQEHIRYFEAVLLLPASVLIDTLNSSAEGRQSISIFFVAGGFLIHPRCSGSCIFMLG